MSCPIPAGIFAPSVCIGALVGRIYGEIISDIFPTYLEEEHISPGVFALVGAAALGSCVTRTTSIAIIIYELSGQ